MTPEEEDHVGGCETFVVVGYPTDVCIRLVDTGTDTVVDAGEGRPVVTPKGVGVTDDRVSSFRR